jgi:adenosine kinase
MAFNLSAEYTIQFALDKVTAALEHSDYIFSNEHEAAEFGKSQGLEGVIDLKEVAKKLASWKKSNQKRPRVAIITQGPQPVIVAINYPG